MLVGALILTCFKDVTNRICVFVNILFLIVCWCGCLWDSAYVSKVPIEIREDVGCPGAGVTGGYKLPGVVAGN